MTEAKAKTRKPDKRSRRAILDSLKSAGAQDAETLAAGMGLSAMAVRQHLYGLEAEKLVTYEEEARPLGRPAKLWRLTPAADRFFPDAHQDLAVGLLSALRTAFGEAGLEKLLALRTAEQIAAYEAALPATTDLRARLEALAARRSEEGYMAEVRSEAPGRFLLIENHCPVCAAAASCQGLCAAELTVFRRVLGPDVAIERSDHILAGARRCAYRVRALKTAKAASPAPADRAATRPRTRGSS
ncbi:MAG TPA: metalloregulator ArsR/SmtB family transcription factor [Kiloniellaceae bacterium]|nr:metalloregulator ArsR/SmtB family transcription factor [Kiloniellaceae bacterium]